MPLVSVVMSVFDCSDVVRASIDSVLGQTMSDFEFIIVDDCSSDRSIDVVRSYDDPRIKLLRNQQRSGLARSLNIAMAQTRGKHLARMDADDVCHPTRLERQLQEFSRSPAPDVVGSNVMAIDGAKRTLWRYPERSPSIAMNLLFANAIAHPTVMLRREVLERHGPLYREEFEYAQDYELWTRLAGSVEFRNIQEVLVDYRFTTTDPDKDARQAALARIIRLSYLRSCGLAERKIDSESHQRLSEYRPPTSLVALYRLRRWARTLPHLLNDAAWDRVELEDEVRRRWNEMFYRREFRNPIKQRIVRRLERR